MITLPRTRRKMAPSWPQKIDISSGFTGELWEWADEKEKNNLKNSTSLKKKTTSSWWSSIRKGGLKRVS